VATLGKGFVDALKEGVQKSGEKDTKAFAKALDSMQRNVSGVANLFRGSELVTSLVVRDQLSSTVFSSSTGWQVKGDGTATFRNVTVSGGSLLITNTTDRIHLQSDGDAFFGSNIAAPATTSFSIFSNAQTYNSESMGAGDILFGDNSSGKANLLWDASAGQILVRGGTTTQGYFDTTGAATFGGGVVALKSDGITLTGGTDAACRVKWNDASLGKVGDAYAYEVAVGQAQLHLMGGNALAGVTVGTALLEASSAPIATYTPQTTLYVQSSTSDGAKAFELYQSRGGVTTYFLNITNDLVATWNSGAADIDFIFGGDTATRLLMLDAGLDAVQIGTTVAGAIADFRAASIVLNEAGADADIRMEGDTATSLLVLDAGLGAVQIGDTTAGTIADFRPAAIVFNEASNDVDFRVESNGDANCLFVDGGNDRIGIGTATPTKKLEVAGGDVKIYDLGSELLTNPGFETAGGGGADIWANWTEVVGGGALANETTLVHSGADAAKLTGSGLPNAVYVWQASVPITPGVTYQVSFWTRGDGTNAGFYSLYGRTNGQNITSGPWDTTGVAGATYTQVSIVFTATAGAAELEVYLSAPTAAGGIAYFDDVSVKEVTGGGLVLGGQITGGGTGGLKVTAAGNVGILRSPVSGDAALTVLGDMQASDYTGWNFANETWTYASATTFTVPTDLTAKYQKGTKIKLTQTTAKYFYVTASSYGAPNTTVTVTGGSDYTLANAAITSPYYSYIENPQGFPGWFNYVPTVVGFGATPPTFTAKFMMAGVMCAVVIGASADGTSTSATHSYTTPVAPTSTNFQSIGLGVDNGALCSLTTQQSVALGLVCVLSKGVGTTNNWTASGNKSANFTLIYPF